MFADQPSHPIQRVAQSILRLSDFYIAQPAAATPWNDDYCQVAYRNYYLPLNQMRCAQVIERGQQVGFFEGLSHFIDWGCGPGTASLALAAHQDIRTHIKTQTLFDHSATVLKVFSDLHAQLVNVKKVDQLKLKNCPDPQHTLLTFSYSLTELQQPPEGWNQFEALMILEPSTSDDGRKLLALREKLKAEGYSIWAPCTHQKACPLLNKSKHDWCHDRLTVDAPEWFEELENYLPMRNRTVTMSYLLARKKPVPASIRSYARLTGDSLEEKGKTRQLVCRGEEREFLTWMHKSTTPQVLSRGDLVKLPENLEVKSNELRVNQDIEVSESVVSSD